MIKFISKACYFVVKENWILIAILLIGAFFRLYNIAGYMTFLGDEGRDAIVVRNLLVHADPILIGPGTSVGGMYLGPLYYYFMAPFLFLAGYSPIGPAVGVALLGVATIFLVFVVGRDWFSEKVGLFAALLYAISPTVIIYSRSSWNPNIMPFFSLLSIYSIWKAYESREASREVGRWLIICAISFAFVLQSHYLGILLAPVLLLFWFKSHIPIRYNLYAITLFLFLMSPLLLFDIRHDWMNSRALYKFLTVREEILSINLWSVFPKIYTIFSDIAISLLTAKNILLGKLVSLILLIFIISFKKSKTFWYIIPWLIFGIIGLALYKGNIYDHYFGFLFPASFLLIGLLLDQIYKTKFKLLSIIILLLLIYINLINNPLRYQPNYQMNRSVDVVNKIIEETKNKKFNFAVIAQNNYEDGYQYFLEKEEADFVEIDAQIEDSVTNQLFVICEMSKEKCDPTHSPKAEIANFGWSKIDDQWEVDGVIIYKLIHSR